MLHGSLVYSTSGNDWPFLGLPQVARRIFDGESVTKNTVRVEVRAWMYSFSNCFPKQVSHWICPLEQGFTYTASKPIGPASIPSGVMSRWSCDFKQYVSGDSSFNVFIGQASHWLCLCLLPLFGMTSPALAVWSVCEVVLKQASHWLCCWLWHSVIM